VYQERRTRVRNSGSPSSQLRGAGAELSQGFEFFAELERSGVLKMGSWREKLVELERSGARNLARISNPEKDSFWGVWSV